MSGESEPGTIWTLRKAARELRECGERIPCGGDTAHRYGRSNCAHCRRLDLADRCEDGAERLERLIRTEVVIHGD